MQAIHSISIEERYFWPLVGIFLGWALTLLATRLKDRSDRRRRIGALLSLLVVTKNQVATLILVSESFLSHFDSLPSYEQHRKGTTERHFLEPVHQIDALTEAINDFAGDHPLHSLRLHGLLSTLLKVKSASFTEAARDPELYSKMIMLHNLTIEESSKAIGGYVRRLAWMHGFWTYAELRLHELKAKKNNKANSEFLRRLSANMVKEIHAKSAQKVDLPNSSDR